LEGLGENMEAQSRQLSSHPIKQKTSTLPRL
jgi:hypothetical protein